MTLYGSSASTIIEDAAPNPAPNIGPLSRQDSPPNPIAPLRGDIVFPKPTRQWV